jgi:hypothetical protein
VLSLTPGALALARERYSDGVGDCLTMLGAERTLLQAEQQYATSTTNVSLNLVQLFKALGGGWEPTAVSNGDATWTLTSYLVSNGIVQTISGWLGDALKPFVGKPSEGIVFAFRSCPIGCRFGRFRSLAPHPLVGGYGANCCRADAARTGPNSNKGSRTHSRHLARWPSACRRK